MMKGLKGLIDDIKAETKAELSPSNWLKKIVDDYLLEDTFKDYLFAHREDCAKYLDEPGKAPGRFRASSAGSCLQQQAFKAVEKEGATLKLTIITRPARNARALLNGTFGHIRWHMVFDALDALGRVKTLAAEVRQYDSVLQMTGAFDRFVQFEYAGTMLNVMVDFKTVKAYGFANLAGAEKSHKAQQHGYKLLNPQYDIDRWMMLYEDKDTQELKLFDYEYDELLLDLLRQRYKLANQWVHEYLWSEFVSFKLPLDKQWCAWCPYQVPCKQING